MSHRQDPRVLTSTQAELTQVHVAIEQLFGKLEEALQRGDKTWLRLNVQVDQQYVQAVQLIEDETFLLDGKPPKDIHCRKNRRGEQVNTPP
jgi:hypothetical protein